MGVESGAGARDGVASTGGGGAVAAVVKKISDSCWRACVWVLPKGANGDAGAGWSNASVSMRAASFALSADDVVGMVRSWGKNSTVRAMRSFLVFVTYMV